MPRTRVRRGKDVIIPDKWVGNITTSKTIHNRRIAARCVVSNRKSRLLKAEKEHFKDQLDEL